MSERFRRTIEYDGTIMQSALSTFSADYAEDRLFGSYLGIVLEVYPSDADENATADFTGERRGFGHLCNVLLIDGPKEMYFPLEGVLITPTMPCGIDHYTEFLPRGTSGIIGSNLYDAELVGVDVSKMDGDRCIVSFLGGSIYGPYISCWWPHPANTFDPQTSGKGNDGAALDQSGRYFRRINGVEQVISKTGDIWISTYHAGTQVEPEKGGSSDNSRFARTENSDRGGSVRVNVKPSQTVELSWKKQVDGRGAGDNEDAALPQANPKKNIAAVSGDETKVKLDKDAVNIEVPSLLQVLSSDKIRLDADSLIKLGSDDPASFIALADKVTEKLNLINSKLSELITLYNIHVHTSTAPGSPTSPTPALVPATVIDSFNVESDKVKAD